MLKRYLVAIATTAVLLGSATAASARIIEIGRVTTPNPPSCTGQTTDALCQGITRTTGVQYQIGKVKNPMLIHRTGRIVAFTLRLGKPTTDQSDFFEKAQFGPKTARKPGLNLGAPVARITTLRAAKRVRNNFHFVVTGQSEDFALKPYFGQTVQFPLTRTIEVKRGDLVALTVPSWAPAIAVLPTTERATQWRASRSIPCGNSAGEPLPQHAQLKTGLDTQYFCNYRTAQLTYTATEIVTP